MRYLMFLLIPVMAVSIGCGNAYIVGTPIEKAKVDQIVPGATPENKVVEMFGQPEKKEMTPAGETKYAYSYFEEIPHFWTKDEVSKNTLEVYTKNGVVAKYDFRNEGVSSVGQ
jgi:hypothetical protein